MLYGRRIRRLTKHGRESDDIGVAIAAARQAQRAALAGTHASTPAQTGTPPELALDLEKGVIEEIENKHGENEGSDEPYSPRLSREALPEDPRRIVSGAPIG